MYILNTVHATLVIVVCATSSVRLALHYRLLRNELAHQRANLIISILMFVAMAALARMSWATFIEDGASEHFPQSFAKC